MSPRRGVFVTCCFSRGSGIPLGNIQRSKERIAQLGWSAVHFCGPRAWPYGPDVFCHRGAGDRPPAQCSLARQVTQWAPEPARPGPQAQHPSRHSATSGLSLSEPPFPSRENEE